MDQQPRQLVILLVGPSGSGKTTLGTRIAENDGWVHISEDDIWNEIGHPPEVLRTDAEQVVVHTLAGEKITAALNGSASVVFDFLVYENPPCRIPAYENELRRDDVDVVTRILRPSVEAILERQRVRGRHSDRDVARARENAEHQLRCLAACDSGHVVDTSDESPKDTYERHFAHLCSASSAPPRAAE